MKRWLGCLWKIGQRPPQASQAGREPRLSWKGTPVVEGRQGNPADSSIDTMTDIQLDRAKADTHPEYSDPSKG
jgi:hypothetical protein